MTADDFRRIALGMQGAVERAHMGHPDFRANERIFASLHHDMRHGMVKLTPEEQRAFVTAYPDAFAPENGAWGRQGCTRVRLDVATEEAVGEAVTLAWRHTAKPAPPRARNRTAAGRSGATKRRA